MGTGQGVSQLATDLRRASGIQGGGVGEANLIPTLLGRSPDLRHTLPAWSRQIFKR